MTSDMHSGNVLGNPCVTTCDSFKTVATGVNKIVFVPRLFPPWREQTGKAAPSPTPAARAAQRAAIRASPSLLAAAARNADRALTKTALMGWFALTSSEADALPRAKYARARPGGGFYYLYRADAFDRAAEVVAARDGMWASRLDRRRSWAKTNELKRPRRGWVKASVRA